MNEHYPGDIFPTAYWPFPIERRGMALYSTRFVPTPLAAEDFGCLDMASPASLLKAIPKRQTEFLAGRLCARAALAEMTGAAQTPLVGEDRAPVWPRGFCGSITHSHGWAGAVAATLEDWQSIGLDAETLLAPKRAARLASEILTAHEQKSHEAETAFYITAVFSLKESLFKALYPLTGIRFYFQDAELAEWDPSGYARLRLIKTLSPQWQHGQELEAVHILEEDRFLSMIRVPAP
jgi:enterobactin synthetase component D